MARGPLAPLGSVFGALIDAYTDRGGLCQQWFAGFCTIPVLAVPDGATKREQTMAQRACRPVPSGMQRENAAKGERGRMAPRPRSEVPRSDEVSREVWLRINDCPTFAIGTADDAARCLTQPKLRRRRSAYRLRLANPLQSKVAGRANALNSELPSTTAKNNEFCKPLSIGASGRSINQPKELPSRSQRCAPTRARGRRQAHERRRCALQDAQRDKSYDPARWTTRHGTALPRARANISRRSD